MKRIVLLTTVIAGMMGCNSAVDPGPVTNYPLTKNNSWSYDVAASLTNFRPSRAGATFRDTSISWFTRVRAEGTDTLLDSIATWKFTTHDTGAVTSEGVQHYIVNGDTLFLFAYYNPNLALPKSGSGYRYSLGARDYSSISELIKTLTAEDNLVDTLFVELSPPPVLIFPLVIGTLPMGPLQANLSPEEGGRIIRAALEAGVTMIDTAELYGSYGHVRAGLAGWTGQAVVVDNRLAPPFRQAPRPENN